ncbi:hypothetical protein GCM10009678_14970 [Actinomadura kijaniata]|uniref:Uncharacterized protein n=1 Tax=Actinomadura namibiensis TaxID=182080 RepID=A0A7W3QMK3_ACTNM|nr:hypothetical protein [Actinomadura namibiensis]MBA8952662.1 hypothetical protein [Actinomadura namibiensis]
MEPALKILLVLYCVQALVRFAIHFLLPYDKRIRQMERNYAKDHKVIAVYDDVTLVVQILLVALLFATGAHHLSFLTGLFVGMSLIQVYFHRFIHPLPEDRAPRSPFPPVKLMSFAIQARPGLAWREYALMAVVAVWGLYVLVVRDLIGT